MKKQLAFGIIGAAAMTGVAADNYWAPEANPLPSDYKWSNDFNWNTRFAPTGNDAVYIANAPLVTPVLVDGPATCRGLELATGANDVAYLRIQPGGSLVNTWEAVVVGRGGKGFILQTGGVFYIPCHTLLGHMQGSRGEYVMSGGEYVNEGGENWATYVGYAGEGQVTVYGGSFKTKGPLIRIGGTATGHGRVDVHGGEFYAYNTYILVGDEGVGELYNHGGLVRSDKSFHIGYAGTAHSSRVHLLGGEFFVGHDLYVGYDGEGGFYAKTNATVGNIYIAQNPGSRGRVELEDMEFPYYNSRQVVVGKSGHGELVLKGGKVLTGGSSRVTIRENEEAFGLIQGWGELNSQHPIINNGLVVADGFGADRTLKITADNDFLSYLQFFTNTIPNATTNGWYARNGGKFEAPPMRKLSSPNPIEFVWGESVGAAPLALVNSLRITTAPFTADWQIRLYGSLLAPDRSDVPALSVKGLVVGVWDIRFLADTYVKPQEIEIRYDHVATKGVAPDLYWCNPSTKAWTKLETTALPGHRVKAGGLSEFSLGGGNFSPGLIAAVKPPASNLFFLK